MALQHRIRRIVAGLGLIAFALCAFVVGMYLYALLIFTPGYFLTLSGCLDEFPDSAPDYDPYRHKPWYAQPLILLLFTAIPVVCMILWASWLLPTAPATEYVPHPTPISSTKDPNTWIDADEVTPTGVLSDDVASDASGADICTYTVNTSSKVFHRDGCSAAEKISADNRLTLSGTRDDMIAAGYRACGTCNP